MLVDREDAVAKAIQQRFGQRPLVACRSQGYPELDLRDDRFREVSQQLELRFGPHARLVVHDAEHADRLVVNDERDPRVRDHVKVCNGKVALQDWVLACVRDDEGRPITHGVLAERVAERRLALGGPRLAKPEGALEELPMFIDEANQRRRCVNEASGHPR